MDRYVFNPFTALMLMMLAGILFFLLLPVLFLSLVGTAFAKLGFSWREVIALMLLTLVGSFVNIPLASVRGEPAYYREPVLTYLGILYRIREYTPTTLIGVNLGGAVIPAFISCYLLWEAWSLLDGARIPLLALAGIAIVSAVTKAVARPVRGVGIVTPFFIPPLAALICGTLLSTWSGGDPVAPAIIAYVSGTIGTLVGADLLNIHRFREIGAPVVSIGGAGTFDGIFLTGVIAAFLA